MDELLSVGEQVIGEIYQIYLSENQKISFDMWLNQPIELDIVKGENNATPN